MIDKDLLYEKLRIQVTALRTTENDQKSKLSQAEFGEVLGLTRSSVANLETGKQNLSIANIYALCEHFNLNLLDLLPTLEEVQRSENSSPFVQSSYSASTNRVINKLKQG